MPTCPRPINNPEFWHTLELTGTELIDFGKRVFVVLHADSRDSQKCDGIKKLAIEDPVAARTVIGKILVRCSDLSPQHSAILCRGIIGYANHLFNLPEASEEFLTVHHISGREMFYERCGIFAQMAAYNFLPSDPGLPAAISILTVCADRLIEYPDRIKSAIEFYIGAVNNCPTTFDIYPVICAKLHIACGKALRNWESNPREAWNFFTSMLKFCDGERIDNETENAALAQIKDCVERASDSWIRRDAVTAGIGMGNTHDFLMAWSKLTGPSPRPMQVDRHTTLIERAQEFAMRAIGARQRQPR